jgi:outer membrane lipoprotein LolB
MPRGLSVRRSIFRISSTLIALYFIAACAHNIPTGYKNGGQKIYAEGIFSREGRIAIRVDSEPPQSLSGAFTLSGNAHHGDLSLSTPLGSILAQLSWTPGQAVLKANGDTSHFASTDALMQQATGTVLPLAALFDWLVGLNTPVAGWQTDLSQINNPDNRRLTAKRTAPLPEVELRIVLDK